MREPNSFKFMGSGRLYLMTIRKLTNVLARLLSISLEKSWGSEEVPKNWRKADVTPILKNGLNNK